MTADFAALFIALWVGHTFADHWVQTDHQAQHKGQRDRAGRLACLGHVWTLTLTQIVLLLALALVIEVEPASVPQLLAGLAFNAGTHYWIDRRFTLAALCERIGKGGFYRMGSGLGTGAYALDQSVHVLMLFVTALILAA